MSILGIRLRERSPIGPVTAKLSCGAKLAKPHMAATEDPTPVERRAAMTWAQRLKRIFNIDIETWNSCGGQFKIIACIEDPVVREVASSHGSRACLRARVSLAVLCLRLRGRPGPRANDLYKCR